MSETQPVEGRPASPAARRPRAAGERSEADRGFRLARLRTGEWTMGLAGLALAVVLFALPWYGFTGPYAQTYRAIGSGPTGYDGLQSLHVLGPLALVAAIAGLSAWLLQASRGAPALPVCATVVTFALACLLTIGLVVRVLIAPPEISVVVGTKAGAYIGLVLAIVLAGGAYRSLRRDGIAPEDGPGEIETLRLAQRSSVAST